MPQCAPYNSTKTPYYPETYPSDIIVLLTSKIVPANRTDIRSSIGERDKEPLIGRTGVGPYHNATYRAIMTDDAYFELYEKYYADIPSESQQELLTNNLSAASEAEDLGTLVWRFGKVPFESGIAHIEMQGDGNLVVYSESDDGSGSRVAIGGISDDCFVFDKTDDGVTPYYDNFYLAWIPEENQAAVFPGYWDERLPRVWSSSEGFANGLPYTPQDYNILNPCYRASSILSLLGSILVLYMIVGQWVKRRKTSNTKDRILVGICILDLFFSVGLGIATAATPPDFRGVVGAMGSVGLCDAQGFMIQLGMAVPMYYSGLSLVFLLYVIRGKRIRMIESRVEPMIHFLVWTVALSTAVTGLALELYNSNGQFCYIEPYPYNCEIEFIDCTRGEAGVTLIFFFAALLVGVPFVTTTILFISLYYAVWDQDRKLRQRYGDLWNGNMERLKKIKVQACLYIGGSFVVWSWTSIRLLLAEIGIESPFWLSAVSSFTLPLQGFINFLIFVRQPIALTKKDHPTMSFAWVVLSAIKDYPFVESSLQKSRKSFRRCSSQKGMSPKSRDRSQKSTDSANFFSDSKLFGLSEGKKQACESKERDQSQKSSESVNFFSDSQLFVLSRGKDQEGAC